MSAVRLLPSIVTKINNKPLALCSLHCALLGIATILHNKIPLAKQIRNKLKHEYRTLINEDKIENTIIGQTLKVLNIFHVLIIKFRIKLI